MLETSAPKERSKDDIVAISDKRGALVRVRGSSLSKVAGIKVKQAFFAPAIGIAPCKAPFPVTKIESIFYSFLAG